MKSIDTYIKESLNAVDVDAVKDFLIKKYKASSWEECVDSQKFGDCRKVCSMIIKKFPGMFDCMYDCSVEYSEIAVKKLNSIGDYGEMWGNHYVLSKNRVLYDFGKGTNTISGVYLLTQYNDMKDKYTVKLSNKEQKCIKDKIKRII